MSSPVNEIYFHEDDYCQVEILPGESLTWCLEQMGSIREFSQKHWSGSGWDDMFIRNPCQERIAARGIVAARLRDEFCPPFDIIDDVFTGYSTYREKCSHTFALRSDRKTSIFVSSDDGIVDAMWLHVGISMGSDAYVSRLVDFMGSQRLIMVDWSWGAVIGPSADEMAKYASGFDDDRQS
jgi:hypothetical protein